MISETILEAVREAAKNKYSWPGGYPLYVVMSDGESLCCACISENIEAIEASTREGMRDGWCAAGVDVNWGDDMLFCAHCGTRIESAYAD